MPKKKSKKKGSPDPKISARRAHIYCDDGDHTQIAVGIVITDEQRLTANELDNIRKITE